MKSIKMIRRSLAFICLPLALSLLAASMSGCSYDIMATDLMEGIEPKSVNGKKLDNAYINGSADFSVELFKKCFNNSENILISPLSVQLALAMTANGAEGKTLEEMESVICKGLSINEINEYLHTFIENLASEEKTKFEIFNSIWFRDDERLKVEKEFLQINADYYKADAYKAKFDNTTLKDINFWVKNKTDRKINKILDEIPEEAVIYLINTALFDAEWQTRYLKDDISSGKFTAADNSIQKAKFMRSDESLYIEDSQVTGFIKPYYKENYSFVALLPDEGVSIENYVASLTGEKFTKTITEAQKSYVRVYIPQFSYEYYIDIKDPLMELGIKQLFDPYNCRLNKMGTSYAGNLFVGVSRHKTYIEVDERGTKAGAASLIGVYDGAGVIEPKRIVRLDRPFVYAIIDNKTNLPIFIGALMSLDK